MRFSRPASSRPTAIPNIAAAAVIGGQTEPDAVALTAGRAGTAVETAAPAGAAIAATPSAGVSARFSAGGAPATELPGAGNPAPAPSAAEVIAPDRPRSRRRCGW